VLSGWLAAYLRVTIGNHCLESIYCRNVSIPLDEKKNYVLKKEKAKPTSSGKESR